MQTILGANGQIAIGLARELRSKYTDKVRLVSRTPRKVNIDDILVSANLLDEQGTIEAVQGSTIVYFTAGLPPDTKLWEAAFPVMLKNAITATRAAGSKFVYFDNTYMYPQDSHLQTEETSFDPIGPKAKIRAAMTSMVLDEINRNSIPIAIARAPEFYGPEKTQSFTNALIFDKLKSGQKPQVPVRDDKLRTLIWTPDASSALALIGNTSDTYNETWHLPCDDGRLNYCQLIALASELFARDPSYVVLTKMALEAAALTSNTVREMEELLPRYENDNLFDSTKFKRRFPDFEVTPYKKGIEMIYQEWKNTF